MPAEPVDRGHSPPAQLSLALAALVAAAFLTAVLAVTGAPERAMSPAWAGAALPFGIVLIVSMLVGFVIIGWAYLLVARTRSST